MEFKVGDKVKVKKEITSEICREFVTGMDKYRGKILTINEVHKIEDKIGYFVEECGFIWTEEMIELVITDELFSFEEVIMCRQPNQTWIGKNYVIHIDHDNDIMIEFKDGVDFGTEVAINTSLKCYKLEEEKYSFQEAFKYYEKGRIIISIYGYQYKKEEDIDLVNEDGIWKYNDESFTIEEIRGLWSVR